MRNEDIITVNTAEEYAALFGCPPICHPLLSVCRLSAVKDYNPIGKPVRLNLYTITIKDKTTCNASYGWRNYDFTRGCMNFFAPGQVHSWEEKTVNTGRWGWMLAFHPDFIRKYPLGEKIGRLKFFSYNVREALHISDMERNVVENIMENIESEYKQNIDVHTQDIIVSQLDVLLNYSERFYTRQFQTRSTVEPDIVTRLYVLLQKHIDEHRKEFISVNALADELNMSSHYLSDLLRNQTGMNTQQHIHAFLIERAKSLLVTTQLSVSGEMTYRTDPKTGQKVSLLGYGCMRWPPATSAQKDGCPIDQEVVNELIDYAIERGVNYFDTAPIYGQGWSETVTGKALKRHPREPFLIATKMSGASDLSRENLTAMYHRSFQHLQVDYMDYYLLHGIGGGGMDLFNRRFIQNGMLDFLLEERERGKIRHLGWSFHGDIEVFNRVLEMHEQVHWDFVQIQLNYVDWRHASAYNADWQKAMGDDTNAGYLYGELARRDIPVVVMEPLLGGRLANVTQDVLVQMKQMRPEESAAAWAFRFAGSFPKVLTVLSGMTYKEHLQDNLRTFSPLNGPTAP